MLNVTFPLLDFTTAELTDAFYRCFYNYVGVDRSMIVDRDNETVTITIKTSDTRITGRTVSTCLLNLSVQSLRPAQMYLVESLDDKAVDLVKNTMYLSALMKRSVYKDILLEMTDGSSENFLVGGEDISKHRLLDTNIESVSGQYVIVHYEIDIKGLTDFLPLIRTFAYQNLGFGALIKRKSSLLFVGDKHDL